MPGLFFIRTVNGEQGPMSGARVRALAASGGLTPYDSVRRAEDSVWYRAGDAPGLEFPFQGTRTSAPHEDAQQQSNAVGHSPERGLFEVQTINSGAESWVKVEASSAEEAIRRVASLGVVVGKARLVEVLVQRAPNVPPAPPTTQSDHLACEDPKSAIFATAPRSSSVEESRQRKDASTALVLAWLGLLFIPFSIWALIWGLRIKEDSSGKYGSEAVDVAKGMCLLWGVLTAVLVCAGLR